MSVSYTKNELVAELSGKLSISAEQARTFTEEFVDCLTRAFVRSDKVVFKNFGTMEVRVRKAKIGRNPRRPDETYRVPPKRVVRFKAGRELDNLLNNDDLPQAA